ncbi:MAG: glycine cleavage T C-terminal barrel domain-containing protein [Candidatus Promineifilaceae bacterium]|nr:glycine cleavage T C-terminal barrel domain-containing protein [Candidatus Promineifilaceae bacterium]
MTAQIDKDSYAAAHQSAVWVDRSNLGMLKFSGESRLDLIHRMSTQAVNGLSSGEGTATILTTDIGRIIDRLILYTTGDSVYALTGENNADNIARYLMRFVFFNDDFHIDDLSAETTIYAVYGPQASRILGEEVGFPEVDIPLHHWREAEIAGVSAYLHRTDPIQSEGYFVMCEARVAEELKHCLQETSLVPISESAFDYLRVEAGQPRFGRELTQEYIPLEAGLWSDVSFTKGCYIGQEIIARMESRGKLAKRLVKLQAQEALEPGSDIMAGGKKAGTISSAAVGLDRTLALGYVKTAVLDKGEPLQVGSVPLQQI